MSYVERLAQAQAGDDPRSNITEIKRAVIDEVKETDPRIEVSATEYFNHTFAPDLVLSWPADNRSRYLYIRTSPDPLRLQEDVSYLAPRHPVLFNLGRVTDESDAGRALTQMSVDTDVLVTDALGLGAVIDDRRTNPVVKLASAALLQGGRGVVDESRGHDIASAIATGFAAARQVEPEGTARATTVIGHSFDEPSGKRLGQFLQAIWVGSGGGTANFPGGLDLSSDLSDDAFQFLLELDEFDDVDFWRKIGRSLTLDRVSRMKVDSTLPNFQHLIQSNLDVLWARICRILHTQPMLTEEPHDFRWAQESGLLALRGARFLALVADRSENMRVPAQEHEGIAGEELTRRADSIGRRVEQVELSGPAFSLLYESQGTDAAHDRPLREILSTLGTAVRVKAASVVLGGGRLLKCDFEKRTAQGRGPATFPVAELVENALRVMERLDSDELRQLSQLVESAGTSPEPEWLF